MKNVVDYYNKTATWSEEFEKENSHADVLKKFYDCYAEVGTVHPRFLELGSGAGYNCKYLAGLGAKVVGLDISEKLVEIAKKNVANSKFFIGDMTESYDVLGRFDGIVCLETIIHVDIQKMRTTFLNASKALKKGGLLLISALDGVGKNTKKSYVQIEGEAYDRDFNNYNAT